MKRTHPASAAPARRARIAAAALLAVAVAQTSAGTLSFEEDFALAPDRAAAIKQLIPGTEQYYFYTALHLQNQGKLDEVDKTLAAWIKQHGRTSKVEEIENRQALLKYEKDAKASLDFIIRKLGIYYGHERETQERAAALPTALDPSSITRQTLMARALANNSQTLGGFEENALEWLASETLSDERLHELLSRLRRPDLDGLVALVARDLSTQMNSGFGSLTIHRSLLLAQLDELVKLKPTLLNETQFVNIYMGKLAPPVGVNWKHDAKEHQAYLERLWAFVSRLGPAHNSLKANVLFRRLDFDRKQGVYDKARFLEYLALPKSVWYINPKYIELPERRDNQAQLSADYSSVTMLPPIHNDDALVRDYLRVLFVDARDYDEFKPLLREEFVKEMFAEAKLLAGVGDAEKWYALLTPSQVQALKDRVDLEFAPTNKDQHGPGDAVALDVDIKNVKTLIVKVYEVNATNYYKTYKREVNTDINLDGLVANEERTIDYGESPLRRIRRHFEFPKLNKRGVYVIELIGNGKSSRALVRKGKLRFLERTGPAGHTFAVLDEANKRINDARLWLSGHEYAADKDGTITVPYSTSPGNQPIVLMAGDFATLERFQHAGEAYNLGARFHVARESLRKYGTATVAIRPALNLGDVVISPKLLEEVTLVITSVTQDNISTTKEVRDIKLYEDQETDYEFAVPDRLKSVTFTLRAKVQNVANSRKDELSATRTFNINAIDASDKIEDIHFAHIDGQYYIDVLGKTGEARADRPVNVIIKHRDFKEPVRATLKSDAHGRIKLGALPGIDRVQATGPENTARIWDILHDQRTYTPVVHGAVGEVLRVPYIGREKEAVRPEFSLLEVRSGSNFVADRFAALTVKDGFLEIKGLPAGDYSLALKGEKVTLNVSVAPGEVREGWVLSDTRFLQTRNRNPLQIVSTSAGADKVTIQLANAGKTARVHVFATRFTPEFSPFHDLVLPGPSVDVRWMTPMETAYESGRAIGDEYRYIIDRKYAAKFAGNMLTRPGLLLNPWAIRSTDTGQQEALQGGQFHGSGVAPHGPVGKFMAGGVRRPPPVQVLSSNLDFLGEPATVLLNLAIDEKGVVVIDRKTLGAHNQVHIVAADPFNTVYRELSLPQPQQKIRDLRMLAALDSSKHFTQQKQISLVKKGETISLSEGADSTLETYDSVAKLYRLYSTLRPNATLAEFGFILTWPQMKMEEKREKYSKYACHELHFFLSRRDPEFFSTVVAPYLKNKKDKTFMDHYLLGSDLAGYTQPWAYGRLNTVERVLLAQRVKGEAAGAARHIKDRFDLLPPNIDRFNSLFDTAVATSSLERDGKGGEGTYRGVPALPATQPALGPTGAGSVAPGGGVGGGGGGFASDGAVPADVASSPSPSRKARAVAQEDAMAETRTEDLSKKLEKLDVVSGDVDGELADEAFKEKDAVRREVRRRFYRKLDKTMEWVENNYYHLPIQQQVAALVNVDGLWKDFAQHVAEKGAAENFLSRNLAEPTENFTEIMFALSVLDLPFEAPRHETTRDNGKFTLTAGGAAVVFHKELREAQPAEQKTPILVSQNYYRASDRYTFVDNERTDKYVSEEFLTHVVYGCQVVITNPTSSRQKLDALMQLPRGAMPVNNARYTSGQHIELQPYETRAIEYAFYFPATGEFEHYPVQVAKNEKLVASAAPAKLKVVAKPSKIDTTSWDYISQHGTPDEVIKFLQENNVERLNLENIAWRMRDAAFYNRAIELLRQRHVYQPTLWSYSLRHNDTANIHEFLQHQDGFIAQCGAYIDSKILTIDPVVRYSYEHMEYAPLVNARTHRLGQDRKIVNERFFEQYQRTLNVLAYYPTLTDQDKMAATYYLLLQDRVEEGLNFFKQVDASKLAEKLQYDYFTAYAAFYGNTPSAARAIAEKHKDHPVDRWRFVFANVLNQLDELEGKGPRAADTQNRDQQQDVLATTEPTYEFRVDARKVLLNYRNVSEVKINYYLMDIELMFSQNPFLTSYTGGAGRFSLIRPNDTAVVKLDGAKQAVTLDVPEKFLSSNVMIEIVAAGQTKSQAYYANALTVQLAENYGTLSVLGEKSGKPLPKVYVKVYARMKDGRTKFYKDGYTDVRGKFDYTSLSTDELDAVDKFSMLILSDTEGAVVREAGVPKR